MVSPPKTLDRHPLAGFFLVAFGISWGVPLLALLAAPALPFEVSLSGYAPLAYVAVWGPAISAVVLVWATRGRAGLAAYVRRTVRPSGAWYWYVAVAAGIPLVYLAAALVAAGGEGVALPDGWLGPFVVVSLLRLTQGPVEEFGWRGVALPLLQRRYSGLVAAAVLGAVWALWHVPALLVATAEFQVGGATAAALARLFASLIATSVVLAAAYNGSGGSVPLAVLFHWLTNLPYPWESEAAAPLAQDVLTVVVAAAVVVALGRRYLGRRNLATRVLAGDGPADVGERR